MVKINLVQYDKLLTTNMRFNIIVMIIMGVLVVGLVAVCMKYVSSKWAIGTLLFGSIIVASVYFMTVLPIKTDIKNHDYSSYRGDFYVEEYSLGNRRSAYIFIKLPQDDTSIRYKVVCDIGDVSNNSTYKGTFVIANNSKILVDLILE